MKLLMACSIILQAGYGFAQFDTNTVTYRNDVALSINTSTNNMNIDLIQTGDGIKQLISPTSIGSKQCKVENIKIKTYKLGLSNSTNNADDFYRSLSRMTVTILDEPNAKKFYIFLGRGDFYYSDGLKVVKFELFPGGIQYQRSCVEASESPDGLNQVVSQFKEVIGKEKSDQNYYDSLTTKINLARVTPIYFFSDSPNPGGEIVMPQIDSFTVTDGVLELAIKNPKTKKVALVSIDIQAKMIVKSIVDGQQMDITTKKPFASFK